MIDQIIKSLYIVFPLISIIGIWFYVSFQKLKQTDTKNLNLLCLELASEKKTANLLKNTSKKVELLSNSTHKKLQKIKVDILNIDFTLSEIFK